MISFSEQGFKYTGDNTKLIAFPVGGFGAGMFCVEGSGMLSHFSLRHRPNLQNEPGLFAAVTINSNGGHVSRILEGPVQGYKIFGGVSKDNQGFGTGSYGKNYGLPRFSENDFTASFPFCEVGLTDSELPVSAKITAWSPFDPPDADSASLPFGGLEYEFKNIGSEDVEGVFYFAAPNFMGTAKEADARFGQPMFTENRPIDCQTLNIENGFRFFQPASRVERFYDLGWLDIFTDETAYVDCDWFRGGWFDSVTMQWNQILHGRYESKPESKDKLSPGATLAVPFSLKRGEAKTIRIHIVWYVPYSDLREGPEIDCDWNCLNYDEFYQPWYAGRFSSIDEASKYCRDNYDILKEKSLAFNRTLFGFDLPEAVINAVSSNLSILKSSTILRQADGKLWGWEGCQDSFGSCHGTCTHVWNYAQVFCKLFPELERSLRETEFEVSQQEDGYQKSRASLPIRKADRKHYAAADGQLGGIIRFYREWKICKDDAWLLRLWPKVKQSLEYCIATWDPDENGVLTEPHHNTYDIEFWGADIMCSSYYLGALKAVAVIAQYLNEDNARWMEIYQKGKTYVETELFNGEYFYQKVRWKDLKEQVSLEGLSESAIELLEKEGPKYQYGTGCLSDGVVGAWLSKLAGLGDILDRDKIISHLLSVYRYNLKRSLASHSNPQRSGFALGAEGGLLICSWPKGGKPSLPFVYSDEVWTGVEHQVASHLLLMGYEKEAVEIETISRARYDGKTRNPFSEFECGNWYARAMSSYSLLEGYDLTVNISK